MAKEASAHLTGKELNAALDMRARELAELAVARGFRAQLSRATKPYRTMREFVRTLYDMSHHERRNDGKEGPKLIASKQQYEVSYFAKKHRISAADALSILRQAGRSREKANA